MERVTALTWLGKEVQSNGSRRRERQEVFSLQDLVSRSICCSTDSLSSLFLLQQHVYIGIFLDLSYSIQLACSFLESHETTFSQDNHARRCSCSVYVRIHFDKKSSEECKFDIIINFHNDNIAHGRNGGLSCRHVVQ